MRVRVRVKEYHTEQEKERKKETKKKKKKTSTTTKHNSNPQTNQIYQFSETTKFIVILPIPNKPNGTRPISLTPGARTPQRGLIFSIIYTCLTTSCPHPPIPLQFHLM